MYNSGQSCCSIERVYVHKDLYNDFIDLTNELISNQYIIGDPLYEHPKDIQQRKRNELIKQLENNPDPELVKQLDEPQKHELTNYDSFDKTPNMGPMAQKSSIEFLSNQVNDAINKGATLIIGDNKGWTDKHGKGRFFKPTLLKDCNHTMDIMKEESFGPLLPTQCVNDDNEAIELMNDSNYGLTAAIYTMDKMKMERLFAPKVQAGTIFQNRCDYLDPFLPWTGVKDTGKGVSLSPYGFNNFTKLKSLHFKTKT